MATRTKTGQQPDPYLELILAFPVRPIRSDEELDRAIEMIDSLLDRDHLEPGEKDYLDILSDQVERYEESNISIPRASDAEILRHLLEAKGVTQTETAQATGIAESTISEVRSGRRHLNRSHIGKLARYFHVEPGVFNFD